MNIFLLLVVVSLRGVVLFDLVLPVFGDDVGVAVVFAVLFVSAFFGSVVVTFVLFVPGVVITFPGDDGVAVFAVVAVVVAVVAFGVTMVWSFREFTVFVSVLALGELETLTMVEGLACPCRLPNLVGL